MRSPLRHVAIVVRPYQEISDSPSKVFGGIDRVVAGLIRGLAAYQIEVTLFTAKKCVNLPCNLVQPIGEVEEYLPHRLTHRQLAAYAGGILKHIQQQAATGRSFDLVNIHHDPLAFVALQGIETPVLTTLHMSCGREEELVFGLFPRSLFSGVSKYQLRSYPSSFNLIGYVHNGVDPNGNCFSAIRRNYLTSISNIIPEKGQKEALTIFKMAETDADLVIAGEINDRGYFKRCLASQIDVDLSGAARQNERAAFIQNAGAYCPRGGKVIFLGAVNSRERDLILKHTRGFLFPSRWREGCPMVLLEAGLAGAPILLFDSPVNSEIVVDGRTGYLRPSLEELAACVPRLETIHPRVCRNHIKRNFSFDQMVDGYLELFAKARHQFTPQLPRELSRFKGKKAGYPLEAGSL
ncbi:MAG: glycosyltransferase [Thermodesulfobacteriota bacterium]